MCTDKLCATKLWGAKRCAAKKLRTKNCSKMCTAKLCASNLCTAKSVQINYVQQTSVQQNVFSNNANRKTVQSTIERGPELPLFVCACSLRLLLVPAWPPLWSAAGYPEVTHPPAAGAWSHLSKVAMKKVDTNISSTWHCIGLRSPVLQYPLLSTIV